MALHIKLLSSFQIEDEHGTPSEIMKSSKGSALLSYLIVTRRPQNRETIADLLWDATSTAQSLQNLRKLLSRIRKWLPELEVTRKMVTFPLEAAESIDLVTLTNALVSKNTAEIEEALALYDSELLHGFYLDDAPRFNEWLHLERERLRQRVTTAYRQLASEYTEQQCWQKGINLTQRWFSLDIFDEEALRQLMQMLAADGQVEAALQQYSLSRARLWDELGVEPERSTKTLVQQLTQLKEEQSEWLPGYVFESAKVVWPDPDGVAEPGSLPTVSMVPYRRNPDFTGRKQSLIHLATKLLPWPEIGENFTGTLAVTGMGGLGKTQLAVEFCYRYGRFFPGGVFWLSFAEPKNVPAEVAAIGGERGMGLYRDSERLNLTDQVGKVQKAWQDTVPRLLIFDNCEDEGLLMKWLPVTGGCRVLVTSRRTQWSHELQVNEWPLSTLEPAESMVFLQRLAPTISEESAQKISETMGHLPLALHLAGSYLNRYRQVTAEAYLDQLWDKGMISHPSLVGRGVRISPTGHTLNISHTFEVSLEQLSPTDEVDVMARKLLARAAYFAPGESIAKELLISTINEKESGGKIDLMALLLAEDSLERLLSLGFLVIERKNTVVMHRLIAVFTLEIMKQDETAQRDVENAIVNALVDYQNQGLDLSTIPVPKSHLQYVTDNSFKRHEAPNYRLSLLLGSHFHYIGDQRNGRVYFLKALKAAEEAKDVNAQAESWVGLANNRGNLQERLHSAEQAEKLLTNYKDADKIVLGSALHNKGWALYQQGKTNEALKAAEKGFAVSTGHSRYMMASNLNLLGIIHYYTLGQYEIGDKYLQQALSLFRELGHQYGEATILNNMGENARMQGDYASAADLYQKGLAIMREIGNETVARSYLINMCGALVGSGAFDTVIKELEPLIVEGAIHWRLKTEAHQYLSMAFLGEGELELALANARQALAYALKENQLFEVGRAWRELGRIADQLSQPIQVNINDARQYDARTCFAESLKIFRDVDVPRDRALTLWYWAVYEMREGDKVNGANMWQEARALFTRLNLPIFLAKMD